MKKKKYYTQANKSKIKTLSEAYWRDCWESHESNQIMYLHKNIIMWEARAHFQLDSKICLYYYIIIYNVQIFQMKWTAALKMIRQTPNGTPQMLKHWYYDFYPITFLKWHRIFYIILFSMFFLFLLNYHVIFCVLHLFFLVVEDKQLLNDNDWYSECFCLSILKQLEQKS